MQLLKWILGNFVKSNAGHCGGVKCVDIVGKFGTATDMKIYYDRPDANTILSYTYEYQNLIENDNKLRGVSKNKTKYAEMAQRLIDTLFAPYAEKIFNRCEGFVDENDKPLEKKPKEEQFKLLKEYHSYHLADLCSIAFELNTKCKKKD